MFSAVINHDEVAWKKQVMNPIRSKHKADIQLYTNRIELAFLDKSKTITLDFEVLQIVKLLPYILPNFR